MTNLMETNRLTYISLHCVSVCSSIALHNNNWHAWLVRLATARGKIVAAAISSALILEGNFIVRVRDCSVSVNRLGTPTMRRQLLLIVSVGLWHSRQIKWSSTVAYLGFGKGGAWQAYNGGLEAEPPAGFRGRAPGRGIRGQSPLKLKHFLLLNVQWKSQIRPFFLKFGNAENHSVISDAISHGDFNRILYRYEKRPSNIVKFCNSCCKTAKNAPFHKSRF